MARWDILGGVAAVFLACAVSGASADTRYVPGAEMAPVVSGVEASGAAAMPVPEGFRWRVTRTEWTASDERAFGEFVTAIGESNCRTFDECLKGPWNIYPASGPKGQFLSG